MARRKTTEELIKELRVFNHHESAQRMQELLDETKQKPQRQDSLDAQLRDLAALGNKHGMYDAADLVQRLVKSDG